LKLCISTVVSADDYQWFIPLFCHSAKLAYPDCGLRIFVRGTVHDIIKNNKKKFGNPDILENQFLDFPTRRSTCNALRHLINPKHYQGYDIVYPTDVDFIILPHRKPHWKYYENIMRKAFSPYAACRGPVRGFKNHPTGVKTWSGVHTRVAAGCSMYKYPDFYQQTADAREYYTSVLKMGGHDKYDEIASASYREYDEVMLYRLIHLSGLRLPGHTNIFINGEKADPKYRDIHLGDFKFKHRWNNKRKMKRILHNESVKAYRNLSKNTKWNNTLDLVMQFGPNSVVKLLNNLEEYLGCR